MYVHYFGIMRWGASRLVVIKLGKQQSEEQYINVCSEGLVIHGHENGTPLL